MKTRLYLMVLIFLSLAVSALCQEESAPRFQIRETLITRLQWEPAGASGTEFDYLPWGYHLQWSPDMRRVAYWSLKNNGMFLVVNGVAGKPFDATHDSSPRGGFSPPAVMFSPDSRHFAYIAGRGKKQFAIWDGRESKPYDLVRDFRFSPDSQHYAYLARRGKKQFVVRDGKEGQLYDWIAPDDLHFSADSQRLAYWVRRKGRNLMVLHEGGQIKEIAFDPKASKPKPVVTKQFTWPAHMPEWRVIDRNNKSFILFEGKEGAPHDYLHDDWPYYSPNRKHVAWRVNRNDEMLIVVDGVDAYKTGAPPNGTRPPPLIYSGSNLLYTLVLRNRDIFRVEIEIAPDTK